MYWHLMVEAKKLAYADLLAQQRRSEVRRRCRSSELLSKSYAATLCGKINPNARAEARP